MKRQISYQLNNSPLHLLHRVSQSAERIFNAASAPISLTVRQYAVLQAISDDEGLNQTDIVARTGIDRSTLAEIVRRLVAKRLVKRKRNKVDARAYAVKLTEDGMSTLRAAQPVVHRSDQTLMATLPNGTRELFLDSLSLIVSRLAAASETTRNSD